MASLLQEGSDICSYQEITEHSHHTLYSIKFLKKMRHRPSQEKKWETIINSLLLFFCIGVSHRRRALQSPIGGVVATPYFLWN